MGEGQRHNGSDRVRTARPGNFWWLVAAPTCWSVAAWFVPGARHGRDGLLLPSQIAIGGIVPLVGLLLVVVYIWRTRVWRQLWPYLPFAVVAGVFAASMLELAMTIPPDESQDAVIPILQVAAGFLQALLALGGGLTSFFGNRRRFS